MNMKMLRRMQNKMVKIQEELAQETIEGTAGGGAVVVTMTGQQEVQAVEINPDVVDPEDVSLLEDLILAAFTEALTKSQELAGKRLGALTGGLGLGNLGFLAAATAHRGGTATSWQRKRSRSLLPG